MTGDTSAAAGRGAGPRRPCDCARAGGPPAPRPPLLKEMWPPSCALAKGELVCVGDPGSVPPAMRIRAAAAAWSAVIRPEPSPRGEGPGAPSPIQSESTVSPAREPLLEAGELGAAASALALDTLRPRAVARAPASVPARGVAAPSPLLPPWSHDGAPT